MNSRNPSGVRWSPSGVLPEYVEECKVLDGGRDGVMEGRMEWWRGEGVMEGGGNDGGGRGWGGVMERGSSPGLIIAHVCSSLPVSACRCPCLHDVAHVRASLPMSMHRCPCLHVLKNREKSGSQSETFLCSHYLSLVYHSLIPCWREWQLQSKWPSWNLLNLLQICGQLDTQGEQWYHPWSKQHIPSQVLGALGTREWLRGKENVCNLQCDSSIGMWLHEVLYMVIRFSENLGRFDSWTDSKRWTETNYREILLHFIIYMT